MGELIFLD